MSAPLLVLVLSVLVIGTTEFTITGLLPQVTDDPRVPIPSAGWLISGYAFAVAPDAPLIAMATARLERKKALLMLMGIFIVDNLLCAVAANYGLLMLAWIVTAFYHGAFFGIGSVVAANLVAPNRHASAVTLVLTGLALANVLGVPLGAALGQEAGWRVTFWVVTLTGVVAFVGLARVLPNDHGEEKVDLRQEVSVLKDPSLWLTLGTTVLFAASIFALFTYVAPLLGEVAGASPRDVIWTLLLIDVGLTVDSVIGGRLADWRLGTVMAAVFAAMTLVSALFSWTSQALLPTEIALLFWAVAALAVVPTLQVNVVHVGYVTPNLVATLNIGAFNVGNTLGTWVNGSVIDHGLGLTHVPLVAAALAVLAPLAILIAFSGNGHARAQPVLD